jgi:hypothetical protein
MYTSFILFVGILVVVAGLVLLVELMLGNIQFKQKSQPKQLVDTGMFTAIYSFIYAYNSRIKETFDCNKRWLYFKSGNHTWWLHIINENNIDLYISNSESFGLKFINNIYFIITNQDLYSNNANVRIIKRPEYIAMYKKCNMNEFGDGINDMVGKDLIPACDNFYTIDWDLYVGIDYMLSFQSFIELLSEKTPYELEKCVVPDEIYDKIVKDEVVNKRKAGITASKIADKFNI